VLRTGSLPPTSAIEAETVSTHEKDKSKQESTHAADLQGFEDDKPYTAGLGAFLTFLSVAIVGAMVAATQILGFWTTKDILEKETSIRADSVAFRQKDQALAQKGGQVSASVEIQGRTQNVTYDVAPIEQGIQYLIKHPQYFKTFSPTQDAAAPAARREAPKAAPVARREAAPAARREAPKAAPTVRRDIPQPAPQFDAASLAAGKKIYQANACWTCHGNEGKGDGAAAAALPVKPANFVLGNYKYGNSLGDIFKVLSNGSPNKASGMVGYTHIPENDRWSLAKYVFSLKASAVPAAPKAPSPAPRPAPRVLVPAPRPQAPAVDTAAIARGKQAYQANACWTCHGNEGKGDGAAAAALPVKPANFVLANYKYGNSLGDIYKVLSNGSPNKASGMVGYTHIPESTRWDIAKFLVSLKK